MAQTEHKVVLPESMMGQQEKMGQTLQRYC